ncbi:MAG: hypothetical protein FJY11_04540 [Bacteroidetes bacterium]|nr:hypothetical protein [Bacteroidota bacterium]
MGRIDNHIRRISHIMALLCAVLAWSSVTGQQNPPSDTTLLLPKGSLIRTQAGITIISRDSLLTIPSGLKLSARRDDNTITVFYDSLKYKASRTALGKRIYDLVIVEPGSSDLNRISNRSLNDFSEYNGLLVNSIRVISLHPFGTDILNPESVPETVGDIWLNKTHWRTRESIVKKYLLFGTGDTLTGLNLSETERNLRILPFLNDARIVVVPVSDADAEIIVITRDSYSVGGDFDYRRQEKGELILFDNNLAGFAHSFEIGLPYDFDIGPRPGIRLKYSINNIARSFANLEMFLLSTPLEKNYGFSLKRDFISAESEYAGGIAMREVFTTTSFDSASVFYPLEFTYQDYWMARSFLLDRVSLSRIILGVRYIHNNVYERPQIDPLSYYSLQMYRMYLGSLSFSIQKFYKTSYIYNYGRTEDIPYGLLAVLTAGREINEFKTRNYIGMNLSAGNSPGRIGYINLSAGASLFAVNGVTEQGMIDLSANYFTSLITTGNWKIRGFINIRHTAGFNRYTDEYLTLGKGNIVTGFSNDSLKGQTRTVINNELVAFSPLKIYGFRFTFFAFSDVAFLGKSTGFSSGSTSVKSIGGGIRLRNNNLTISTFQLRFAWYPGIPQFSDYRFLNLSGEQVLRHRGYDAGQPAVLIYR